MKLLLFKKQLRDTSWGVKLKTRQSKNKQINDNSLLDKYGPSVLNTGTGSFTCAFIKPKIVDRASLTVGLEKVCVIRQLHLL